MRTCSLCRALVRGGRQVPRLSPLACGLPPGPGLQLGTCGPAGFTPSTGPGSTEDSQCGGDTGPACPASSCLGPAVIPDPCLLTPDNIRPGGSRVSLCLLSQPPWGASSKPLGLALPDVVHLCWFPSQICVHLSLLPGAYRSPLTVNHLGSGRGTADPPPSWAPSGDDRGVCSARTSHGDWEQNIALSHRQHEGSRPQVCSRLRGRQSQET